MSEKPNWTEKANVALNTIQVLQNDQLQKAMKIVGALQAEQVRLESNKQQAQERESRLRELVWNLETGFAELLHNPGMSPCGLYILSTNLQALIRRLGVSTAAFSQFEDKDRLGKLLSRIEQSRHDCNDEMSDQQKSDTETFVRYQAEAKDLSGVIEDLQYQQERSEELLAEATEKREAATKSLEFWRSAMTDKTQQKERFRQKRRQIMANVGMWIFAGPTLAALILAVLFVICPLFLWAADGAITLEWNMVGFAVCSWLLAIALTILCIRLQRHSRDQPSVQQRIAAAEHELKVAEEQVLTHKRCIESPGESENLSKFQVKSVAELMRLQAERESFLSQFRGLNGIPENDLSVQDLPTLSNMGSGDKLALSQEVQNLARCPDRKIEAIKLHREQTGAGLADAKEAVENYMRSVN